MPTTKTDDTTTDLFDEGIDGPDDSFFDPAPSEWIKLDDLAVGGYRPNGTKAGRSILFYPATVQLGIEGDNGKPYNALYGTLVVLDGPVGGRVDELPFVIEDMKINGAFIVTGILALFNVQESTVLGGRDNEHKLVPKNPRRFFVAGKLNSKKNKNNTLSWFLEPLSDSEKTLAKKVHAARMASA